MILKDKELKKKFIAIEVDNEFNKNILKVTMQWFKNMEAGLRKMKNPNPQLTLTWLN